ncbi:MAG: hypothetical protein PVF50_12260 [Gammaproteobacteria bacterium]|jgi:hypothetical protein
MHAGRRIAWAVLATSMLAVASFAQTGHPAKGSWLGYWGPNDADQRRIRLLLDWEDRTVTGRINPGRNEVPIAASSIDYDTWTLTIEAEMPAESGNMERFVAIGVLDNLGSWTNRRYAGTYTFGNESGQFELMLN